MGEDSLLPSKSRPAVDLYLSHSKSSHSCRPKLSNKLMTSSLGLHSPTCHCTTGGVGSVASPSFCFLLPRSAMSLTHIQRRGHQEILHRHVKCKMIRGTIEHRTTTHMFWLKANISNWCVSVPFPCTCRSTSPYKRCT